MGAQGVREEDKEAKVSRLSLSLSNCAHPTLLATRCPRWPNKEEDVCRKKVTKINKSETPPPTANHLAKGWRCSYAMFSPSYARVEQEEGGGGRGGGRTRRGGYPWAGGAAQVFGHEGNEGDYLL